MNKDASTPVAIAIGTLLSRRRERGVEGDPLLSLTQDKGILPQNEAGRRNIASANKTTYWRVYPDDIVYNTMRMWQGASARSEHFGIVSPAYTVCCPASGVSSRFVSYALKLPEHVRVFRARSQGLTSDVWTLRFEELARIGLKFVPSYDQQERIAAILSSVDDAIDKTQAVIDQVQVVKRGLMQELLTRGLPGRHTRFKQTEIGKIPEDWRLFRIEQIGVVEAGRQRSPKAQGTPRPYLRVANVYDGYIDTTSLLSMPFSEPEFARLKLVPGDLLLNEGQSKELVGRCAQYSGEPRDCGFQNTLVRFQAGEHIKARFAFWVFRHYFYAGVFSAIARQTTSVAHLGVSRFAKLKLALPDLEEQAAIVEGLETLNSREELERCRLSQLGIVKSALMSVLLTGELRVIPEAGDVACSRGLADGPE